MDGCFLAILVNEPRRQKGAQMGILRARRPLIAVILGALLPITAACSSSALSGSGNSGSSGSSAVVKIGFVAELSGQYAGFSIPGYDGSQMAVAALNKTGVTVNGKKYKFQLVMCNDQSQTTLAASCTNQLIRDDKVNFIVGGIGNLGPIIENIADPAGVMYFTSSSAAVSHIAQTKYMISTLPSVQSKTTDAILGIKAFLPNAKRLALIYPVDVSSQTLMPEVVKMAEKEGLQVVANEGYPSTATDIAPELAEIRAAKPDVMFMGNTAVDMGLILKQSAQVHPAPAVFANSVGCEVGVASGYYGEFIGDPVTGLDIGYSASATAENFNKTFDTLFHPSATTQVSSALTYYDAYGLLARAMAISGSTDDVPSILKAMTSITDYQGINGPQHLVDRQDTFGLDMCLEQGGKVSTVKHIGG